MRSGQARGAVSHKIRVIGQAGLRRDFRAERTDARVVVEAGATLATVLDLLGIDVGLVGVAACEGRIVRLDAALERDCVIHVYALVGGG